MYSDSVSSQEQYLLIGPVCACMRVCFLNVKTLLQIKHRTFFSLVVNTHLPASSDLELRRCVS